MNRRRSLTAFFALCALSLLGCPGDGGTGSPPRLIFNSTPECIVFPGGFPSGLIALPDSPGDSGRAAVVQIEPIRILSLDLEGEPPQLLSDGAISDIPKLASPTCGGNRVDSDLDGRPDPEHSRTLGFACSVPAPATVRSIGPDLVGLVTSRYEQLLFLDPTNSELRLAELDTPSASGTFDPDDWPFWPAPGTRPFQSGFSTRVCLYGSDFENHLGDPLGANTRCDDTREGYFSGFSADSLRVGDQLFVSTSNLNLTTNAFEPGTVLRFDYDDLVEPPRVRPNESNAVLFTTGFNPTSLTQYTTPSGRDLVLVAVTGAVDLGLGADLVRTDSSIDVIDADTATLIATIPLGLAGSGFSGIALDSTGRIGLMGASTRRALFAIDLAPLDDPMLGLGPEPLPVLLDGSTPGFGDARLFDSDRPFDLPKRSDGPAENACTTHTSVAVKPDGDFAVATDFCDGTISVLTLELPATRSEPIDPARVLTIDRVLNVAAPLIPSASGEQRAIELILVRPGRPGIDFTGPDVHYTLGLTEGAVCGIQVESP